MQCLFMPLRESLYKHANLKDVPEINARYLSSTVLVYQDGHVNSYFL